MKPLFRSKAYYNSVVIGMKPLVYFPLDEASGSVAKNWGTLGAAANGTHTGVDLHAVAGPKGGGAPYFDGTNDYTDIYSAALAAAFDGQEGSALMWIKAYSSGVWSDGVQRHLLILWCDSNNNIRFQRTPDASNIAFWYVAGSVQKAKTITAGPGTDFIQFAFTWTLSGDSLYSYMNGSQLGAPFTTLGTWAGTITTNSTLIGSQNKTPNLVWNGYLSHFALWDRVLTLQEIQALA